VVSLTRVRVVVDHTIFTYAQVLVYTVKFQLLGSNTVRLTSSSFVLKGPPKWVFGVFWGGAKILGRDHLCNDHRYTSFGEKKILEML